MSSHKVIGYFAYKTKEEIFCDEDACIIAGSEKKMYEYLTKTKDENVSKFKIKKTRLSEIMNGMEYGGAYSFDEEAYNRFYPLAQEKGIKIGPQNFKINNSDEIEFVRVQKNNN